MSDKLKKFIDDNRESFDNASPGSQLYKKIQQQFSGDRKKKPGVFSNKVKWYAAAAVITCLVLSGYFLNKNNNGVTPEKTVPMESVEEKTGIPDPLYAKQILQFKELIGMQQSQLRQLQKEYPQLYKQFIADMNELDSSYQVLKTKLADNTNQELLMEAMIQNLQLQSDLLGRQLSIIKEIKQKNKRHEKTTI